MVHIEHLAATNKVDTEEVFLSSWTLYSIIVSSGSLCKYLSACKASYGVYVHIY